MSHTHVVRAIDHLAAVAETREHLHSLYDDQRRGGLHGAALGAKIAEAHQKIGHGLKAAGIEANIAQAIALERIADTLVTIRSEVAQR